MMPCASPRIADQEFALTRLSFQSDFVPDVTPAEAVGLQRRAPPLRGHDAQQARALSTPCAPVTHTPFARSLSPTMIPPPQRDIEPRETVFPLSFSFCNA